MPRRQRRAGGFPRADPVRVFDRGHPAAGRVARRGRGRAARHRRGVRGTDAGAGGRRAAAYAHRIYNTAVVIHRGRVLGVVPKSYLPTYREFYERRQMAAGDLVRGAIRMGDAECRSARICCSPRPICPVSCCTSRSVRTCSCRSRRVRRPRWRVRRCWPTCPAARSRSVGPRIAACWPARRRRAASPPMCTRPRARANRPRIWPGTARP